MATRRQTLRLFMLCVAILPPTLAAQALSPPARELFKTSMQLAEASFDTRAHLLRNPPAGPGHDPGTYLVRESSWYALGLLARDLPANHHHDRITAAAILEVVLAQQYADPHTPWYGTFRRSPEEPLPPASAVAFTHYDPNWRHFIGTTFQIILERYPRRIPPALAARMYTSIDLAIAGEQHDGRLKESYSNIALMYGALWDFAAAHGHNPQWQAASARWNQTVFTLFRQHNTFAEFNSPTYYGVDLYGLALWRLFGSTPAMRRMGSTMEAALWTDIADFYQPSLRNISGPYDRSYGMDMESYVSVTGVWLRAVLPAARAPLPASLTLQTDHIGDIFFTPQIALLGARIPPASLRRFSTFAGSHLVTRPIDDQRTATAWIGTSAMWGGESTSLTRDAGPQSQFHPATAQWRAPTGQVAWLLVTVSPAIDATASAEGLTIHTAHPGDVTIRIAPPVSSPNLTATSWTLPGMTAAIATDGVSFTSEAVTLPFGQTAVDVTYHHVTQLTLSLHPVP